MSYDIFVQDLPAGIRSVADIADDFVPKPLGSRAEIVARIREAVPTVTFRGLSWGVMEGAGYSIEVDLGTDDPVFGFALHVRGGREALRVVAAILIHLRMRAVAPAEESGLFPVGDLPSGFDRWNAYRDRALNPE